MGIYGRWVYTLRSTTGTTDAVDGRAYRVALMYSLTVHFCTVDNKYSEQWCFAVFTLEREGMRNMLINLEQNQTIWQSDNLTIWQSDRGPLDHPLCQLTRATVLWINFLTSKPAQLSWKEFNNWAEKKDFVNFKRFYLNDLVIQTSKTKIITLTGASLK